MIKQSWTLDWTEGSCCSEVNFAVQQKSVFNTAPFISPSALSLLSVLKSVHSQEDGTMLQLPEFLNIVTDVCPSY
jgi:hypothetical protein